MAVLAFDILARDRASSVFKTVGKNAAATGTAVAGAGASGVAAARGLVGAATGTGALLGALGITKVIKDSIAVEKQFGATMTSMAAVAGVPAPKIKELSALALKMGADTVFSANDAATAMLELAKGGMTAAAIQGGALKSTLTLASAGGLELGAAATYMSTTLSMFSLKAADAGAVAAALAGGANASTASVESLGLGLAQVGPAARIAGLSMQDTVAALAAFDQLGLKGSDGGTSLKTMLSALVPSTKKAREAMKDLNVSATDSKGAFKPIATIAGDLQKGLSKLSQEQQSLALKTIFGSDATRAAYVLSQVGKKGIVDYTKATSDLGAAQRVADARMGGTSGALERLSGNIETVKLRIGQGLAPTTVKAADALSKMLGATSSPRFSALAGTLKSALLPQLKFLAGYVTGTIVPVIGNLAKAFGPAIVAGAVGAFLAFKGALMAVGPPLLAVTGFLADNKTAAKILTGVIVALVATARIQGVVTGVQAAGGLRAWAAATKVGTAVTKVATTVQVLYNAVVKAGTAVVNGSALAQARAKVATVATAVATKVAAVASKAYAAAQWLVNAALTANPIGLVIAGLVALGAGLVLAYRKSETFRNVVNAAFRGVQIVAGNLVGTVIKVFRTMLTVWLTVAGGILAGAEKAFGWVPGIGDKLRGAKAAFTSLKDSILGTLTNIENKAYGLGENFGTGFARGISDRQALVIKNAQALGRAAISGVRSVGDVRSPSRKMAAVGSLYGEGFAIGMRRSLAGVTGASVTIGATAIGAAGGAGPAPAVAGAPRSAGGDTIVININGPTDPAGAAKAVRDELVKLKRSGMALGLA